MNREKEEGLTWGAMDGWCERQMDKDKNNGQMDNKGNGQMVMGETRGDNCKEAERNKNEVM